MNTLKPMFFTTMKTYNGKQFVNDLVAGLIVAIIALPLSIALALASGVSPEQGIYTAIIAGFIISVLGGSQVQIAGPTAAFATIVAGIVAKNGMDGLIVATLIAGAILILMGVFRLGGLIKFIPYTITTGFTAGIAVTIVIGQLKDFFGVTYPAGMETVETVDKLRALAAGFSTFSFHALLVGVVCLLVQIIMPKISEKIPGSLVAVIVGILMVKLLPLNVNTIGDLYTLSNKLPGLHIPEVSMTLIRESFSDGVIIAVLAAIESLLSCVVADGMINGKHRSDAELVAQGAGNIASALFGGIPATGAIARTAANIKNGGRTPVAGMVHAVVLAIILVVLMPFAGWIPMPTIASILFIVAYNMCGWRTFVRVVKTAPKSDIAVLVTTFVLTVVFDLVVAIEVGMLLTGLLFIKRSSEQMEIRGWVLPKNVEDEAERARLMDFPKTISVYEIKGPMFFGAASQIDEIAVYKHTKCLIIRMQGVPSLDITAFNALKEVCDDMKRNHVQVILSHVNEQPMKTMEKAGFVEELGKENFCDNIDKAMERAKQLIQ